jgi:hypothetical protein
MAATTADSEVIKEFLISLGFKIDEAGMKKFNNTLLGSAKGAMAVGGGLLGAAIAVEKFVESVADGMEKLFYISQRTGASITNIKAMEGAFQSAGFAAGKSTEFIESLAENIRSNPGMAAFVEQQFGLDSAMDKAQLFMGIMHQLADMAKRSAGDRAVAGQMAQMVFGMNDKDFQTAIASLDKIDKIENDRIDLIRRSGVNMEDLSKQSVEFNNNLRKMGAELGTIGTQFADVLMPAVNKALHGIEWFLDKTIDAVASITTMTSEDFANTLAATSDVTQENPELAESLTRPKTDEEVMAAMEKKFHFYPGTIAATRDVESSGGKDPHMNDPDRVAVGPLQINRSNLKALHITEEQAKQIGPASQAWSEMFERNLDEFKDYAKAFAATNSNPQHVRDAINAAQITGRSWTDYMNKETQDYLFKIEAALDKYNVGSEKPNTAPKKNPDGSPNAAGGNLTLNQTVNVNGSGNPDATGRAVAEHTKRTWGDATRDLRTLNSTPGRG